MKHFLLILFFPLVAFAQTAPIEGNWTLTDRSCNSGARPHDGFVLDRDSWQISFNQGRYDSSREIMDCSYWSRGDYRARGNVLELDHLVGASNCTNQVPYPHVSVFFTLAEDVLKIYTNNNTYDSTCPIGDVLESVFNRDRKLD